MNMKRYGGSGVRGFTLIELMIVVAIVGVLASISLVAYQDYTARAQLVEAFHMSAAQREMVVDYHSNRNVWPSDNATVGMPQPASISSKYISQTSVTNGRLEVRMRSTGISQGIAGQNMWFSPLVDGGAYRWVCRSNAQARFLPSSCR